MDMLRDTLTFHLGMVIELLLSQAFNNSATALRYFDWLQADSSDENETPMELASAGSEGGGELTILARPRSDEFLCCLNHQDFAAVMSIAYSASDRRTIGVHLVNFTGKPMLATRWLQGLRQALVTSCSREASRSFLN